MLQTDMKPTDIFLSSPPKDSFLKHVGWRVEMYVSHVRALLMTISNKKHTKNRDEDLSDKKMPSGCDTHVLILFTTESWRAGKFIDLSVDPRRLCKSNYSLQLFFVLLLINYSWRKSVKHQHLSDEKLSQYLLN